MVHDSTIHDWVQQLREYPTLSALRQSSFYANTGTEIEAFLSTPEVVARETAPRVHSFLRVAQWNLEKGKHFEQIRETLTSHEILGSADVILLNEVDWGMCRSGNRHIAGELAAALDMHMVFGAAHFELTPGTGEDLEVAGENDRGIQGNAILSRYPILDAQSVGLPDCFEPFHFHEKRFGWRNCVWACLQIGSRSWWIGSTHLEVRNSPLCRARQMDAIFDNLPGSPEEPHLIGGDLNTNGFSRGTLWRTVAAVWQLVMYPADRVKERLKHPERGPEPLFAESQRKGFDWRRLNDSNDTASSPLGELEDAALLPAPVRRFVQARLDPFDGYLRLRLDWFLGRHVVSLGDREIRDSHAGVWSLGPGCVAVPREGRDRVSDHSPIYADVKITE